MSSFKERFRDRISIVARDGAQVNATNGEITAHPNRVRRASQQRPVHTTAPPLFSPPDSAAASAGRQPAGVQSVTFNPLFGGPAKIAKHVVVAAEAPVATGPPSPAAAAAGRRRGPLGVALRPAVAVAARAEPPPCIDERVDSDEESTLGTDPAPVHLAPPAPCHHRTASVAESVSSCATRDAAPLWYDPPKRSAPAKFGRRGPSASQSGGSTPPCAPPQPTHYGAAGGLGGAPRRRPRTMPPPSSPAPQSSASTPREPVAYKPYTLAEYKKLQQAPVKLGGLGAEDSEEKQFLRQQRSRARSYADGVNSVNTAVLSTAATKCPPAPIQRAPTKNQREAAVRRQRAKDFAEALPKPKVKPSEAAPKAAAQVQLPSTREMEIAAMEEKNRRDREAVQEIKRMFKLT
eukprot:TRINITY_DN11659_c0_g1_i1.p2 TRINITY_DN11659_c0_g1~~TRINITY_DN11659_c0_g1_i1.p2  ORF type:complete len:427 (+),score=73.97 TRINITY_DN11659_c0_g1_i1:69-1283(+)